MVCPHVRTRIAHLKPGSLGYKTAWERLCREYGQTQTVVNAHVSEIINLAAVKGTNFKRVNDFHKKLSKSYDASLMLGKSETLAGLVMTTIGKLPHVKPDLVRTDENWEKWDMRELITNLEKWIKRNKPSETSSNVPDNSRFKKERHRFTSGRETQPLYVRKQGPHCLFCKGEHWRDTCKTLTLWIKERNSSLREDFVLIVAGMGTEKTSVRAGGV